MRNLKRGEKPKTFLPIKSGWLQGAHYNAPTKVLTLEMKSGTYEYAGVSQDVFDDFAKTFQTDDSSGKHFRAHILKYEAKRVK